MLQLAYFIQTFAQQPSGNNAPDPAPVGMATYGNLGTVSSDPWSGWTLHK